MGEYTKGKWGITKDNRQIIVNDGAEPTIIAYLGTRGYSLATNETVANAKLICAAINGCIEINPENPMAVAEGIGELVSLLKMAGKAIKEGRDAMKATCEDEGLQYYDTGPFTIEIEIQQALAKIEG